MECGGKRSATPLSYPRKSGVALRLPPHSIISESLQPDGAPELHLRSGRNGIGDKKGIGRKCVGGDGRPSGEVGRVLDVIAHAWLAVELKDELAGRLAGKRGEGRGCRIEREEVQ